MDMGGMHSVLWEFLGPLTYQTTEVKGATEDTKEYKWITNWTVNLGEGTVTRSFIVISECPYRLLGQDLLNKFQTTMSFLGDSPRLQLRNPKAFNYSLPHNWGISVPTKSNPFPGREWKKLLIQEIPPVWVEDNPRGLVKYVPPILARLKSGSMLIWVKQYPISSEARERTKSQIRNLLEAGILIPCQAVWNTPLIACTKAWNSDYDEYKTWAKWTRG